MVEFIALLFVGASAFAAEPSSRETQVISLEHRSAEEILPLVSPHLAENVSLSGRDYRLIVRASPERLQQLKALVAQLDTPRRQLLITVRYEQGPVTVGRTRAVVRERPVGGAASRSTAPYSLGQSQRAEPVRDRSSAGSGHLSTRRRATPQDTQTLRVLEGEWAYLAAGESEPGFGYPVEISEAQGISVLYGDTFRRMTTGFLIRATVRRKQVTVAIKSVRESPSRVGGGRTEMTHAETRVTGPLGAWFGVTASGSLYLTSVGEAGSLATSPRRRAGQKMLLRIDQAGRSGDQGQRGN